MVNKEVRFAPHANRIALLLVVLAAALSACGEAKLTTPSVPTTAKPLQVKQWIQGGPVDVADGQAVYVLEFWLSWCPHCRAAVPVMAEIEQTYGTAVVVVAVSNEGPEVIESFVRSQDGQMDYPIAADDNSATFKTFGIREVPTVVVIDRESRIVWSGDPSDPALRSKLDELTGAPASI